MDKLDKIEIRFRRGTLDEWNKSDVVPFENEIILVKELHGEMEPSFKLGDGIHTFKDLPYVSWDHAFRNGSIYVRDVSALDKVRINIDA